ncbi:PI-PLC X domain-containing protein [Cyphellophora attinorum]|uniref:PI-PLC X domain-containing protein n=1 Tax=Cyphellophora attinorum TaxID=1664694 RepID=A0A0N1HQ42_9EURO|nr:PI-PLC X domain-containing protein [Phialophora attinorum]KPI40000.1 PI-PLC X domain-containing protein [Phialophora attinorum]
MHLLPALAGLICLSSAAILPRQSQTSPTTSTDQTSGSSSACNNSPDLCSKPYNQITHLGAHDSPFVRDATTDFSVSGNQFYNSTIQLNAGVRLLSAQIHKSNGNIHLCHSSCDLLDAGILSTWLMEIKRWMDNNPREVVTLLLVNSDDFNPSDINFHFTASNITEYVYTPASKSAAPATWPTLNDLITSNQRLLTFVASLAPANTPDSMAYLMDEFTFMFENPFENTKPSDFTCDPSRPSSVKGNTQLALSNNKMPLMNHFLYKESDFLNIQSPDVENITTTNSPNTTNVGMLGQAMQDCTQAYQRAPTFILVDFFDEGPAIQAVDAANGVTNPVGRKAVPARDHNKADGSLSSRTFAGVVELVKQVEMGMKPKKGEWIWAAGQWIGGGLNTVGGLSIG